MIESLAQPAIRPPSAPSSGDANRASAGPDASIRAAAVRFEAVFLAEMLKSAGLGAAGKAFGGGVGEDAFSSFLTREYALKLAQGGGVGLAEQIVKSLAQGGQAE